MRETEPTTKCVFCDQPVFALGMCSNCCRAYEKYQEQRCNGLGLNSELIAWAVKRARRVERTLAKKGKKVPTGPRLVEFEDPDFSKSK